MIETLAPPDSFPATELLSTPEPTTLPAAVLEPQLVPDAHSARTPGRWFNQLAPASLALGAFVGIQSWATAKGWSGNGHGLEKLRLLGHAYSATSKLLAWRGIHLPEVVLHEAQAIIPEHHAHAQGSMVLASMQVPETTDPPGGAATPNDPADDVPSRRTMHPSQPTTHHTYIVRSQDNLWKIAESEEARLGLSTTAAHTTEVYQKIYADNQTVIGSDQGLIHPNQTLTLDGADKLINDLEHQSGSASNTNQDNPNVTLSNHSTPPAPILDPHHPLPDHINHDASTNGITPGMSIETALAHKGIVDPTNQFAVIQQVEHDGGFPAGTVYYEPGDPWPRLRDNTSHQLTAPFVQRMYDAFDELKSQQDKSTGKPKGLRPQTFAE